MRKLLSILSIFCSLAVHAQAPDGSSLRISLLTCSKGSDVASGFGHSAIRVTDSLSGQDIVFNYGTYDFEAPHFVLKFMRGQMDYLLSVCYFDGFISSYLQENRAVHEREFLLEPSQRMAVYATLAGTYNGSGRRYRYDYFRNNCATKIRDIFLGPKAVVSGLNCPEHAPGYTYRTAYGELYLYENPWLMFGLDLLMGSRLDRPLSFSEEMFLPCLLEKNLSQCTFSDSGSPLLGESVTLLDNEPEVRGLADRLTAPAPLFSALFIIFTILMYVIHKHSPRSARAVTRVMHAVFGMTGLLMAFMWFGTEHWWTGANWNLLWMSPLFLIPAFLPESRTRRWFIYVLSALAVLSIGLYAFIPQGFNEAFTPIKLMHVSMWTYAIKDGMSCKRENKRQS